VQHHTFSGSIRCRRLGFELEQLEQRTLFSTDVVYEWNTIAIKAASIDHGLNAPRLQFGPTRVSRALAIVHPRGSPRRRRRRSPARNVRTLTRR
jgi:hypothetical protein